MKQRLTLVLALVMAVAAVFLIHIWTQRVTQHEATVETVSVLVAARDIRANEVVDATMIRGEDIPRKYVSRAAVGLREQPDILNQTVVSEIPSGQVILWSDFRIDPTIYQLSRTLEAGERAVSISVDHVTGISGHIRPDDLVDIIATFQVPDEVKMQPGEKDASGNAAINQLVIQAMSRSGAGFAVKDLTQTLIQSVKVLAVGNVTGSSGSMNIPGMPNMDPTVAQGIGDINRARQQAITSALGNQGYRTVTLRVSPLQAELLAFCQSNATLSLSLRNPEDLAEVTGLPNITVADILDLKFAEAKPERAPAARPSTAPTTRIVE